jgi:hypothetical protein
MLAGLQIVSADYRETVCVAVKEVAMPEQRYFQQSIITELRSGTDVDFKVAYLTFVNTMLATFIPNSIEKQNFEERYLGNKVVDFLLELKNLYPDPTLFVSLFIYFISYLKFFL